MKHRHHSIFIAWLAVALSSGLAAIALAQDDLLKKPYPQWSKAEAQKVLNDSAWALVQEARLNFGNEARKVAGGPVTSSGQTTAEMGGATIAVDYRVTLRLRSALPIRQALVRLKQLEARYDQMSAKARAEFDEKNKGLLACPACAQNYVLTLSCKSTNYPGADALFESLRGATLPGLKPYVYLENDRGERRELIHFVAPRAAGEETIFYFPRFDDEDRPLVTAATRKLRFRLNDSNAKAITNFEIDVSKLLLNGEVAF